jgi:hypothetical protein
MNIGCCIRKIVRFRLYCSFLLHWPGQGSGYGHVFELAPGKLIYLRRLVTGFSEFHLIPP